MAVEYARKTMRGTRPTGNSIRVTDGWFGMTRCKSQPRLCLLGNDLITVARPTGPALHNEEE